MYDAKPTYRERMAGQGLPKLPRRLAQGGAGGAPLTLFYRFRLACDNVRGQSIGLDA